MNEVIMYSIEAVLAVVLVPWTVWVTGALFNLKQEQAMMRMQVDLIKEMKSFLADARSK